MKQKFVFLLIITLLISFFPVGVCGFPEGEDEEPVVLPDTCAKVDTAAINVLINTIDSRPVRSILIDNSVGKQRVNYQASIRLFRSFSGPEEFSAQNGVYDGLTNPSTSEADSSIRILQHEREGYLSYAYGLEDSSLPLTVATRYKADTSGFNLTSVGTWFIGDYPTEGVIQVEVRAGGTSIDNAVPLATGSLLFTVPDSLENGRMYSIPLSRPAAIYPDEDFYVIVTYPSGQTRPQGCVMNQAIRTVSGRYLLKTGDSIWTDLQSIQGFNHCGWLMNAGESIQDTTSWLVPNDTISGSIPAGRTANFNLLFRVSPQLKGVHHAEVTITVGDSCHTRETIPVTLQINEAPYFLNAPKRVVLPENTKQIFEINIFDIEGNSFVVEPLDGVKVASYSLSGKILTLTIAPRTGEAGIYNLKLKVSDSRNESRELNIPIHVTILEDIYSPAGFVYPFMGESVTYRIPDLFRYVNGTGLSFVATVRDEKIVKLIQTDNQTIQVTPDEPGTTVIDFLFLDDVGNSFTRSIPVTVGQCEDPSRTIVQKWNNVLLVNNAAGNFLDEGYQWYKNKAPIPNATAQYYSAGNNAEDMLDFSAAYYVRLVTAAGDTVFSCPLTPVQKSNVMLKAFPNPVLGGELLNIVTGFTSADGDEVLVQLFDFNGRLVQTGRLNGTEGTIRIARVNSGFYMLHLSCKKESVSYGIYVK
ncbi:MAG: T9SS type A sorting domain-containing protein [Tannerella sp.]|jgi:hypothetical protein|nr:T9SS type A sorting domain-containing protein [Tannerella sp.]